MQPDFATFLPAIRRELIRPRFFGADELAQGWSQVVTMRANEVLAHLIVKATTLPRIAAVLLPRQHLLIEKAIGSLAALGLPAPAMPHDDSSSDIARYDRGSDVLAKIVQTLATVREPDAMVNRVLDDIISGIGKLEAEFHQQYAAALAEAKESDRAFVADGAADSQVQPPDANSITALIRQRHPGWQAIKISSVARKFGATANEIYFFDLSGTPDFDGAMVMRRNTGFSVTGGLVTEESALLQKLYALGVSVPRVLTADIDSKSNASYLIMARLSGSTLNPEQVAEKPYLIRHLARVLASIHRVDTKQLPMPYHSDGMLATKAFTAVLDRFYNRWVEKRDEHSLLLETAFSWLRKNATMLNGPATLAHGDFNFRNIFFQDDGVVALDWELARLSHAGEDLAYLKPDIEEIMPWREFADLYESYGGIRLTPEEMRFFEIWVCVWRASLSSCIFSGYWLGEHKSFIYASTCCNEYFHHMNDLAKMLPT
jgi:aminoglycoside phosphotransferase (APT) family kinase protein